MMEKEKLAHEISKDLIIHAVNSVGEGILITDINLPDNPIIYANSEFAKLTGYEKKEILGQNCRFLQGDNRDQPNLRLVRQSIKHGKSCKTELINYRKDGTAFYNELSLSPIYDTAGKLTHFIGVQRDVTDRKKLEEELHNQSKRDPLTQLFNRRGLCIQWDNLMKLRKRLQFDLAVVVLDINHFKKINDAFGHEMGDRVLVEIADMISQNSRETDVLARVGGDEFVAVLTSDKHTKVDGYVSRLQEKLKIIRLVDFPACNISLSIGYSILLSNENKSLQQLMVEADQIMYQRKKDSKKTSVIIAQDKTTI